MKEMLRSEIRVEIKVLDILIEGCQKDLDNINGDWLTGYYEGQIKANRQSKARLEAILELLGDKND